VYNNSYVACIAAITLVVVTCKPAMALVCSDSANAVQLVIDAFVRYQVTLTRVCDS
jgi:hypothetical protein